MHELGHLSLVDIYKELARRIGIESSMTGPGEPSVWTTAEDECNICASDYEPGAVCVIFFPPHKKGDPTRPGYESYLSGQPLLIHDALPDIYNTLTHKLIEKLGKKETP